MSTITETLHLYWAEPMFEGEAGRFFASSSKDLATGYGRWVYVNPVTVEIAVPEKFDARAAKLASLQETERKTRAEFTARITEIQRQISQLQALEMSA